MYYVRSVESHNYHSEYLTRGFLILWWDDSGYSFTKLDRYPTELD